MLLKRVALPYAAVRSALLPLVCLICFAPAVLDAQQAAAAPAVPPTTVLVAVDQRQTLSLNGDWHYILDPYQNGLGSGRSGYSADEELPAGSNKLLEYSFAKSPTIKVPGDWNTQKESLMNYEGGFWYERHFQFQPKAGQRAFLHIGAANYRSRVWINGQLLCAHEGGFTSFDCEAVGGFAREQAKVGFDNFPRAAFQHAAAEDKAELAQNFFQGAGEFANGDRFAFQFVFEIVEDGRSGVAQHFRVEQTLGVAGEFHGNHFHRARDAFAAG